MKVHERLNVVSLVPRDGGRGQKEEQTPAQNRRRAPELLQGVREQMSQLEESIRKAEATRTVISESACVASSALHRFEQTLANLRLSLENQRAAEQTIDSAGRAGHAAALLKAQIMGAGNLALVSHANALPQHVVRLLDPAIET